MDSAARFCRKCGHPSGVFEAQTQRFDAPPHGAQTSPTNFAPTGAAYVPPGPMAAPAAITQGTKPSSRKPLFIVLAIVVVVILMMGIPLLVYQAVYKGSPGKAPPSAPPFAGASPEVPPPPAPPGAGSDGSGEAPASMQAYVYPGSVKDMDFTSNGNGVIHLTTKDPFDKVVDWYRAKLKPITTAHIPFGGTIMEGKSVKAIITGIGGGTSIVLTKDDDR